MLSIPTRKLVHMGRCYPYLPVSWYIWDDVIHTYLTLVLLIKNVQLH